MDKGGTVTGKLRNNNNNNNRNITSRNIEATVLVKLFAMARMLIPVAVAGNSDDSARLSPRKHYGRWQLSFGLLLLTVRPVTPAISSVLSPESASSDDVGAESLLFLLLLSTITTLATITTRRKRKNVHVDRSTQTSRLTNTHNSCKGDRHNELNCYSLPLG